MTLRELEQAATPAPWIAGNDGAVVGHAHVGTDDYIADVWSSSETQMNADAAFIAALRNVAPLLLDVVDAARAWREADYGSNDEFPAAGGLLDALAALDAAT